MSRCAFTIAEGGPAIRWIIWIVLLVSAAAVLVLLREWSGRDRPFTRESRRSGRAALLMDGFFRPYRRLPELAHLPVYERDRIWRRLVDDRHLRFGWASNAARAAVWVFVPLIVPVVGLGVWRLSASEGPDGLPWFVAGLILGILAAVACSQSCMLVLLRPHVRRAMWGNCPGCGYDCRATPDRCPECGMILNPIA